jgi:hypothetical protein
VQNKFHYAITGQTAAEIIDTHADNKSPNMGLQTWKNAPKGRILKSDTKIAKNYLSENEIKDLERAISAYFDHIEMVIKNRTEMTICCNPVNAVNPLPARILFPHQSYKMSFQNQLLALLLFQKPEKPN